MNKRSACLLEDTFKHNHGTPKHNCSTENKKNNSITRVLYLHFDVESENMERWRHLRLSFPVIPRRVGRRLDTSRHCVDLEHHGSRSARIEHRLKMRRLKNDVLSRISSDCHERVASLCDFNH
jgi:hypothetical protein